MPVYISIRAPTCLLSSLVYCVLLLLASILSILFSINHQLRVPSPRHPLSQLSSHTTSMCGPIVIQRSPNDSEPSAIRTVSRNTSGRTATGRPGRRSSSKRYSQYTDTITLEDWSPRSSVPSFVRAVRPSIEPGIEFVTPVQRSALITYEDAPVRTTSHSGQHHIRTISADTYTGGLSLRQRSPPPTGAINARRPSGNPPSTPSSARRPSDTPLAQLVEPRHSQVQPAPEVRLVRSSSSRQRSPPPAVRRQSVPPPPAHQIVNSRERSDDAARSVRTPPSQSLRVSPRREEDDGRGTLARLGSRASQASGSPQSPLERHVSRSVSRSGVQPQRGQSVRRSGEREQTVVIRRDVSRGGRSVGERTRANERIEIVDLDGRRRRPGYHP